MVAGAPASTASLDRRRPPDALEDMVSADFAAIARRARASRARGPASWLGRRAARGPQPARPSERASSTFSRSVSRATMKPAPARAAPMTADSPTPPRPDHDDDSPGRTRASRAPPRRPVVTAQCDERRPPPAASVDRRGWPPRAATTCPRAEGADAAVAPDRRTVIAMDAHEVVAQTVTSPHRSRAQSRASPCRHGEQVPHGPSGQHDERTRRELGEPSRRRRD